MKKVRKDYTNPPLSLRSGRAPYYNAIRGVLANRGWFADASELYRSDSVKGDLNLIYNGKCAFCEQTPAGSPPQVEHFRPKGGVTGVDHTGYYWLAYEWSNLLLSCGNCNSTKGNNFDLFNNVDRVEYPSILSDGIDEYANFILHRPLIIERPKLLNPEIDDPQRHLAFTPSGEIFHLSDRGEESKIRYNLNRDELYVNGRKTKRDGIESKFLTRLNRYETRERNATTVIQDLIDVINEDIIQPINNNSSFSEFYKQMLFNYDDFFIIGDVKSATLLKFAFLNVIKAQ
jgi:uncharacterized protein (TIGR02646 family)